MPQFAYKVTRSNAANFQSPGISCSEYHAEGTTRAHSISAVRQFCAGLMFLPGVYRVAIRNTEDGCEWKEYGPIDTRNPESAAEAVSVAKKKAKRGKRKS